MPDIQVAAALVSSTKTAFEMVKSMVGIRDDLKLQTLQSELRMQLLDVVELAVAAKEAELAFVGREGALKKEIAELKEWKAREGEYRLEEVSQGAFAFVSQPTSDPNAVEVWLCPTCFENRQRSILQGAGRVKGGRGEDEFKCHPCRASIQVEMGVEPGRWRRRMEEVRKYRLTQGG